ncbi:MAG: c-type cytochrome biogenesis protein CcmI [Thioalkalivibrio sp.]|jgi:cytochrome c-type biogenesis protein CcmH|nr:c-type cytochrome biogenesis protein CcmI [Thioalkalivibrio sp.]
MTLFWALAATLTVAALLFVLVPLLRSRARLERAEDTQTDTEPTAQTASPAPQDEQMQASVEVYRSQLADLEADLANGSLSQEQFEKARLDLQRSLLESSDQTPGRRGRRGASWRLPAGVAALVAVPVLAVLIYQGLGAGAPGIAPEPPRTAGADTEEGFEAAVMALRARLEDNPENSEGWIMLARSYAILGQDTDATNAYEQAIRYGADDNPDVLVNYADRLATEDDNDLNERALPYIRQALEVDPDHTNALWLAGLAAFQRSDYTSARERWQRVLGQLPEDAEETGVIRRQLAEVERRLADEEGSEPGDAASEDAN